MIKKSIIKPDHFEFDMATLSNSYGKFWAEPFERGFATTIGNSLRRVMLSSLYGTAVTAIKIEQVLHEFSTIPGVVEDVTDIILNLKQLRIKLFNEGPKELTLHCERQGNVYASDIKADPMVEIVNPELHLATLDKNASLTMTLTIEWGIGYSPAEEHTESERDTGVMYIDSLFSPVERVNYRVENTRVGRSTEYERLYLEIETDGTITPQDAISQATTILKDHYTIFLAEGNLIVPPLEVKATGSTSEINENLLRKVEELELSVRSYNCLKKANIMTIAQLVQKSEAEMLATRNFGRKSLNEIKQIITEMGLSFGMNLDDIPLPKEIKELPEARLDE